MRNVSVLVVLIFAACNFKTSTTSGSGGTTPSTSSSSSGKQAFPDLNGKTPEEAEASLRAAGFTGRVVVDRTSLACSEDEDARPPEGKIDCQSPEPGEVTYPDREVRVHVYERQQATPKTSIGWRELAEIQEMTVANAKARLKQLGHTGTVRVAPPEPAWPCEVDVVCQISAHQDLRLDEELVLYVKSGPQ